MPKRQRSDSKEEVETPTDFVRGTAAATNTTPTNESLSASSMTGDFVRGKASKSESELGSTSNVMDDTDFLFSRSHHDKQQKKRAKSSGLTSQRDAADTKSGHASRKHTTIEAISFKTLRPGIKLLCTVRSVTKPCVIKLISGL